MKFTLQLETLACNNSNIYNMLDNVNTNKPERKIGFCSFLDFSNASSPQGYLENKKPVLLQIGQLFFMFEFSNKFSKALVVAFSTMSISVFHIFTIIVLFHYPIKWVFSGKDPQRKLKILLPLQTSNRGLNRVLNDSLLSKIPGVPED